MDALDPVVIVSARDTGLQIHDAHIRDHSLPFSSGIAPDVRRIHGTGQSAVRIFRKAHVLARVLHERFVKIRR
jgi:hypothetical protein